MKILIGMNLSPAWVAFLEKNGIKAIHWSSIGTPDAPDRVIFEWAIQNEHIVFTNDLDFGSILASASHKAPSVIQARTDSLLPDTLGSQLLSVLYQFHDELIQGALITFDLQRAKARMLPLR